MKSLPLSERLKAALGRRVLRRLFLPEPPVSIGRNTEREFETIFDSISAGGLIQYALPESKHLFLRFLRDRYGVLFHGTNNPDLDRLEPMQQEDYNGNQVTAVFASSSGIWSMFFAVLDKRDFRGSIRNGCFIVETTPQDRKAYYFFSVNEEMLARSPWTDGMVYILPGDGFEQTSKGGLRFDEWAKSEPVCPLARLPVSPGDFPFLHCVVGFPPGESMLRTWWNYKRRIGTGDD